jgi:hypothetical protein
MCLPIVHPVSIRWFRSDTSDWKKPVASGVSWGVSWGSFKQTELVLLRFRDEESASLVHETLINSAPRREPRVNGYRAARISLFPLFEQMPL